MVPLLSAKLRNDPLLRVLIRADRDAEYAFIAQVMGACAEAQIANITFAVLSGDAKPAPAAHGS